MLIFLVPRILLPVLHRAGTMKPYCVMHTPPKNKSLIREIQIARSAGPQQHRVNRVKKIKPTAFTVGFVGLAETERFELSSLVKG